MATAPGTARGRSSTSSAAPSASAPSACGRQRLGDDLAPRRRGRGVGPGTPHHTMPAPTTHRGVAHERRRAGHPARAADDVATRRATCARRRSQPARATTATSVGLGDPSIARGRRRRSRCRRRGHARRATGPARSTRPGFCAAKHTVSSARTAAPRAAPVSPSTPDGMSTATTTAPPNSRKRVGDRARASPSSAPRNPVPYIASTTTSARGERPREVASRRHPSSRWNDVDPRAPAAGARAPRPAPSPPLLPLPHTTTTAPSPVQPAQSRPHRPRHRLPGPVHQHLDRRAGRDRARGRPRPSPRASGPGASRPQPRARATAIAMLSVWVSEVPRGDTRARPRASSALL